MAAPASNTKLHTPAEVVDLVIEPFRNRFAGQQTSGTSLVTLRAGEIRCPMAYAAILMQLRQ